MTDRSKFEQMLEYLISEEQDKAREIFHQLVVEKSREIYEQILAEDFEEVEESDEEEKEVEEDFFDEAEGSEDDEGDEEPEGGEDDGEVGGDATDDFMGDVEAGDDEDMDGGEGEGDLEDRVMDLEDALDDLRSEFEQMMGDDEMGPDMGDEMGGDEMGPDMGDEMGGDEMGAGFDMKEPMKDSFDVSDNFMREYIEKVTAPKHGDDGVNTKSIVAGKNDMGGTTANIVKGGTGEVAEAGAGGTIKGNGVMKQKVQDNPDAKGNVNVPGGSAGVKHLKKQPTYPNGLSKESGADTHSPLNGAPKRAK